jgi:hypothetical protein
VLGTYQKVEKAEMFSMLPPMYFTGEMRQICLNLTGGELAEGWVPFSDQPLG